MDTADTFENSYDLKEHPVVSAIDTVVYWREFLKDLLPESSHGILVVFENACTVSFTYKIV
jgi:hypothetical protein